MASKQPAAAASTAGTATNGAQPAQANPPQLNALEEDDEFEEFAAEDWNEGEEVVKETDLWEDNWDEDNVEDDFSVQLRAELEKTQAQQAAAAPK